MTKFVITSALGLGLLQGLSNSASAVPILTLREIAGQTIQWSWDDGTGGSGGILNSTSADIWFELSIPFPSSASGNFYGEWLEDFPGMKNYVFINPVGAAPGQAKFYAQSDYGYTSGSPHPDGTILDSSNGSFKVKFTDGPDHPVPTPDSGTSSLLLAGAFGGIAVLRRALTPKNAA